MLGQTCALLLAAGNTRKPSSDIEQALVISRTTGKGQREIRRRKASISHDEPLIRHLRDNPDFAVQYLKAALEEDSEPRVLLIALLRVVQARGIAKIWQSG